MQTPEDKIQGDETDKNREEMLKAQAKWIKNWLKTAAENPITLPEGMTFQEFLDELKEE